MIEKLQRVPGLRAVVPTPDTRPVYLRLPVLVSPEYARNSALQALNGAGFGATGSYPSSLADVPALKAALANPDAAMPGGRTVARSIVTLPTHAFVTNRDIDRMVDVLSQTVGMTRVTTPRVSPER